jgi:hypothetical protein
LICAVAVKADANMLETTKTKYAVRDTRVFMKEPLVRILTVMGAVYNGLERVYPIEEQRDGRFVPPKVLARLAQTRPPRSRATPSLHAPLTLRCTSRFEFLTMTAHRLPWRCETRGQRGVAQGRATNGSTASKQRVVSRRAAV